MSMLFSGTDAVLAKMRTLPVKLQQKGAKAAVRKAANLVRDAAKANAQRIDDPETKASIPNNIAVQYSSRKSKAEGGVVYRVGVRGGASSHYQNTKSNRRKGVVGQVRADIGGTTFYWRFIELGTSRIAARPFMLPALVANIDRAQTVMVQALSTEIDKLVRSVA